MTEGLNPCPKCGGEGQLQCEWGFCNADRRIYVKCENCGAKSRWYQDRCTPDGDIMHPEVVAQAVEAWNKGLLEVRR